MTSIGHLKTSDVVDGLHQFADEVEIKAKEFYKDGDYDANKALASAETVLRGFAKALEYAEDKS